MEILTALFVLSESATPEIERAAAASPSNFWTPGAIVLCALGLSLLIIWQVVYGGFSTLRKAPSRRNRMFVFLPMILLSIWLFLMLGINYAISKFFETATASFRELLTYPAMFVMELGLIGVMIAVVRQTFARRLKGFGLNINTIKKDAGFAIVYLLAIYPLIMFGLWLVLIVGQFMNEDFSLEVHQSLSLLAEGGNSFLDALVILFAVFVVPVFEEMLFRGFLQTTIRSFTKSPWAAIILTSVLFSILHPPTHVPALFFFSCGLGYAYERSGSLFRSIFMHIFFNGLSVAVTVWSGY